MCEQGEGLLCEEEEAHKFALKAGVGEPFDTDTVTDLHRGILGVLANSDDITNTFVSTDERAWERSAYWIVDDKAGTNVTPEIGQSSFLTCRSEEKFGSSSRALGPSTYRCDRRQSSAS